MQASVRSRYNHALEYAVHLANRRNQPLHVIFGLSRGYPGARMRHYRFLVEGLCAVERNLGARGVPFSVWLGDAGAIGAAASHTASTLITDRAYLRLHREWRRRVAEEASCPIVQIESNVVVPVEHASGKDEYAAATLRPKITRLLDRYLLPVTMQPYHGGPDETFTLAPQFPRVDLSALSDPSRLADYLEVDRSVGPVAEFPGGEDEAGARLADFLERRLRDFDEHRNIPDRDATSGLSPYLHFGHISPVEIALRAQDFAEERMAPDERSGLATLLEELIVRRELAANFTEYNPDYDRYGGLPDWARRSLAEHSGDPRPVTYTAGQLEEAQTEDPYWNACQREMCLRGKMHGYMRMYWGKKILEWMDEPEEAFLLAVELNDKYELDGRDPNGYAGVAWCFGKHDRPWAERPIFGKVRYMNANGLKRKFKGIDQYVRRWT
ncbi:MAG: deoxyribodipyrimidine photo-lyase [Spirochaetales bacterium]|nr:deoxyribodipyrimidine photo-lyase [Spirochaetales bacterium]